MAVSPGPRRGTTGTGDAATEHRDHRRSRRPVGRRDASGVHPLEVHPPTRPFAKRSSGPWPRTCGALGDLTASLVASTETAGWPSGPRERCGGRTGLRRGGLSPPGRRIGEDPVPSAGWGDRQPPFVVAWQAPDGSAVGPGDAVARLAGPLRPILTAERTALNFLGHLSGVATLTRRFVDAVAAANPAVTRPRHPQDHPRASGPREGGGPGGRRAQPPRRAVRRRLGEGQPPRWAQASPKRSAGPLLWPGRMVEVECDRLEQVEEACRAGAGRGPARQHGPGPSRPGRRGGPAAGRRARSSSRCPEASP